ncbi:MAG: hypothetical protein IJ272_08050 [Clostridia bacterium]|nr:hypothetical protein [Clostridia bacterium]
METMLKLREYAKSMLKESKKNKNQEDIEQWKRILELNNNIIKEYKGGK